MQSPSITCFSWIRGGSEGRVRLGTTFVCELGAPPEIFRHLQDFPRAGRFHTILSRRPIDREAAAKIDPYSRLILLKYTQIQPPESEFDPRVLRDQINGD